MTYEQARIYIPGAVPGLIKETLGSLNPKVGMGLQVPLNRGYSLESVWLVEFKGVEDLIIPPREVITAPLGEGFMSQKGVPIAWAVYEKLALQSAQMAAFTRVSSQVSIYDAQFPIGKVLYVAGSVAIVPCDSDNVLEEIVGRLQPFQMDMVVTRERKVFPEN